MKIITEFKSFFTIHTNENLRSEIMKKLNLYWVNTEKVNKVKNGKITEIKTINNHPNFKKLQNSHYNACRCHTFKQTFQVMSDGSFRIKK